MMPRAAGSRHGRRRNRTRTTAGPNDESAGAFGTITVAAIRRRILPEWHGEAGEMPASSLVQAGAACRTPSGVGAGGPDTTRTEPTPPSTAISTRFGHVA